MYSVYSLIRKYQKNLLILGLLVFLSFLLFYQVLNFYLWGDDIYLYWVSRFHPGHYTVYWGHPSTVFEFFLTYVLFGPNPFVINYIGILLRAIVAFVGYLFITILTRSKATGVVFSLLSITSYIGYEATTWGSTHIVLIDLILITATAYWYLRYLSSKATRDFIVVFIFLIFSLISDPGRDFPVIGFMLFLLLIWEYTKENTSLLTIIQSKGFKTIIVGFLATVTIFIGWFFLFRYYFGGAFGRPHERIPFETIKYFFGTLANFIYDPILRTPQRSDYGLQQMDNWYIVATVIIPLVWVYTLYKFFKTRSLWWSHLVTLMFWMFVFYFPNWISYPRSYLAAVHHYSTISGLGFMGLLAILICWVYQKKRILGVLFFIVIISINLVTVYYYLDDEAVYRNQPTLSKIWSQINRDIPQTEQKSLIYIKGSKPFANLGVVYSGAGFMTFMRDQENELYIRPTVNLERIANELCHEGIISSKLLYSRKASLPFHAFSVRGNGDVRNITQESIVSLNKILEKKNSCIVRLN